jgi:hypothetical protein
MYPTSPSELWREFFGVFRSGFPSSLAEGRAKTRTREGTGLQAEGYRAATGVWGLTGTGVIGSKNLS